MDHSIHGRLHSTGIFVFLIKSPSLLAENERYSKWRWTESQRDVM